jgi:hypothetical protein
MLKQDGKGYNFKYYKGVIFVELQHVIFCLVFFICACNLPIHLKGLGTSTSNEAKQYFRDLDTHQLTFRWEENANDLIELAFSKKKADDRFVCCH